MLQKNRALQQLALVRCGLNTHNWEQLFDALSVRPIGLTHLDVSGHLITDLGSAFIANIIRFQPELEVFKASGCGIEGRATIEILSALRSRITLTGLDLSDNPLSDAAALIFSDILEREQPGNRLRKLDLSGTGLEKPDLAWIFEALGRNTSISSVSFSRCPIVGELPTCHILSAVASYGVRRRIYLKNCGLESSLVISQLMEDAELQNPEARIFLDRSSSRESTHPHTPLRAGSSQELDTVPQDHDLSPRQDIGEPLRSGSQAHPDGGPDNDEPHLCATVDALAISSSTLF
ncbi:hypothetical protein H696_06215 [Fonticula alba]|uniref:RNI-like protein n=1 Tax=Fonticula alba TaxID=691883 RepID=A0A058Z099_FONAL|nr:hypothetical protein H696_06215 [Fonticula alba]KCV67363.1 hypothetical protein H696_06215 [Fonticula alba]|eukprot:XP_009498236.1 hypothetical protein H696_06215 [Fonticula alba]